MALQRVLLFFAALFVVCGCSFVHAQTRFAGIVNEVVDGRTAVVSTTNGNIKVQLQYIEVPEPEDTMSSTIRDHLSKLVAGKHVEFYAVQLLKDRMVGRLTSAGVDVSAQMLRDGAAWHEPSATTGQPSGEASDYDQLEAQAKAEKRGVWSNPKLLPPWHVREAKRQAELAAQRNKPTAVGVSQFQTDTRSRSQTAASSDGTQLDAWADVFGGTGTESHGLITYTDPQRRFDVVYTSVAFVHLIAGAKKQKVECRVGYVTYKLPNGQLLPMYLIVFRAISADFNFSKQKSVLTIGIDKQTQSLGLAWGAKDQTYFGAHEVFFYRASKATLKKMSSGKNVELRINGARGAFPEEAKQLLGQLISATS